MIFPATQITLNMTKREKRNKAPCGYSSIVSKILIKLQVVDNFLILPAPKHLW